jgi:hypothetical protein
MPDKTVSTFAPPCAMPNGLQWTDEGLYVIDQYSDRVYLMDEEGFIVRAFETPTANGSGISYGGGYLWTASNGSNTRREAHDTDTGISWVYQLNPEDGSFVNRFRTPDGGGIHGIEWDDGLVWVTAFSPKSLHLCDPANNFEVVKSFDVPHERLHGLARDGDGIWCAHTSDKIIVKYNIETGAETDKVVFPLDAPAPHGLSIKDGVLWYADANVNNPRQHQELRTEAEIGIITR